jgi:hypothetical protein
MNKPTKTLALITLTIVTLSVIPVGLALIALPVRAQGQITVVSMGSSRATGTFYNNMTFYVLIDIGPTATPPVNISVAVRAPSTDGRYYTYSINASQIGTTLTYIVWFNVTSDGYLYWNATNASSISESKPTGWVGFTPAVQYTTSGQYLDIIAGGKTLRLTYSPSEPVIGGYPTEWYAPTSKRSLKDWWILAHDLNSNPLEAEGPFEIINVSIYVDGSYISSVKLTIEETGANTGNFTVKAMIGQLPDVDPGKVMNLTFYIPKRKDILLYDGTQDIKNYWVKSVLIKVLPAPPITLVIDRDYIPLSPYGDVRVYVNVTDPYAGVESVNVSIRVWNFTTDVTTIDKGKNAIVSEGWVDKTPRTYFNVTLDVCDEAGIKFCGNFSVNAKALEPEFVRGKIVINYTGYDGTTKLEKSLPLTTYPVKLSVNATEVKYGDVIEITLVDPYWNLNTNVKNSVPIDSIKFSGNISPVSGELVETDTNTNTFKITLKVAEEDGELNVKAGTTVTLTYTNARSPLTTPDATDWITEDVVVSFKVLSFTGKVVTDKDVYGPYGKMIIYVEDWDANKKINELDYVNITIQRWDGKFIPILNIKETDKSTGVFKEELKLPDRLEVEAKDLVGKVIRIMYRDPVDATGKPYTAIKEVSFTSWDPEISTDKKFYNIGEKILITVKDLDANKDPGALDVITVTVTSTSDPIGTRVTLVETGVNTGVFTGEVLVSDTIGTGRIYAKFGDVINITYIDELPADYGVTGKSKAFTYTVNVGIPVDKPITPKKADFVDPRTGVSVIPKVGSMVGISVELSNVGVS